MYFSSYWCLKHKECMKWWYSLQDSGNLNFPALFLFSYCPTKKCGKIQIPQILDKVQLLGSKSWAFWAFPQLFGRFKTDLGCAILCPFLPLFCNFCLEMWEVLLKTRLLQKWEKCAVLLFFFQDFQDFFPAFPALTLHFNQFNCGFFFCFSPKVRHKHFLHGDLKLKCTATISTVYWKSNEESVQGSGFNAHTAPVSESRGRTSGTS